MELPQTIPEALVAAAHRFGDRDAVVMNGLRISFRRLKEDAAAIAGSFRASGLRKGDRLAIWAPNSVNWIVVSLAAACMGAIIVPLNTRLKGKEAADILRRCRARMLVTVGNFLGTDYLSMLQDELIPDLENVLLLSGSSSAQCQFIGWQAFIDVRPIAPPAADFDFSEILPNDVCDILYTSGTTGQPKGVVCSHQQNIRVYSAWGKAVGLRAGDRYLIVNPLFHSFGFKAGLLACLIAGATMYPMETFDVALMSELISSESITVLPGPPTIFQSLLAFTLTSTVNFTSLRLAVTGAASVPPILIRQMREQLGFRDVLTAYGLTESAGTVTICPLGTSDEIVANRCGRPIPGVEVQCWDEAGTPVQVGAEGEVVVRGYNIMQGYFEDDAATRQTIDSGGWLHTGDVGVLDENGFLRITDRKKDMYIAGGFNCYPAEIERIMSNHPAIAQVAVIGIPDERLGEVGKAFVVAQPGALPEIAEIMAWCRVNMANYKVPRQLELVASLPTNAAGKVQKFALRELYAD